MNQTTTLSTFTEKHLFGTPLVALALYS